MRTNSDTISDLRREIEATQLRRHELTKARILFLTSLLGIGVASPLSSDLYAVLYLIPFAVLIFDLKLLGENFGIRRAGTFIRICPDSSAADRVWEATVRKNRDIFARCADLLGSAVALITAAAALWDYTGGTAIYWCWLIGNGIVISTIWTFGRNRSRHLRKFESNLIEAYGPKPDKQHGGTNAQENDEPG